MLTDKQIEACHKALDEMELDRDGEIDLSDPEQMRELCRRAGLPQDITDKAIRELWDA